MKEFKYKHISSVRISDAEKILNEYGSDGWELSHIIKEGYYLDLFFKKEIKQQVTFSINEKTLSIYRPK